MLYRKFALAVGVLALALIPPSVRAEFMQITFQEGSNSITFSDSGVTQTEYTQGGTNASFYTPGIYSNTQNGETVKFWESSDGVYHMQSSGSTSFGDFGISFSGSSTNNPGTANQAKLTEDSTQVTNLDSSNSHTLTITGTGLGYTSPTGNVYFSQSGNIDVTSGTVNSLSATSYLDTTDTNYAQNAYSGSGSSPSSNPPTTYATPSATGSNLTGYYDLASQLSPNGNTTYISGLTATSYSLTSVETLTFAAGAVANVDPNPQVVTPEPSSLVLAFLGLSCVGGQRLLSRRKKQAVAV